MKIGSKKYWDTPDSNTFIYGLIDPRDGSLRYIGQTTMGIDRFRGHLGDLNNKKKCNLRKTRWMKKLLKDDLRFQVIYLEYCNKSDLNESETFWIQYFRSIGAQLFNYDDGGDASYSPKMSPERLVEHKLLMKEVMNKPDVRKRMSDAHIGQSAWNKGKSYGPETIAKIKEFNKTRSIQVIDSLNRVYSSLLDASKKIGCTPTDIRRCLFNPSKQIKGLTFRRV